MSKTDHSSGPQLDPNRWEQMVRHLGGNPLPSAFSMVADAYQEPHRGYHNTRHILDCLELLDTIAAENQPGLEVEAALWFHDVVYDSKAKDNEEQSIRFMESTLREAGVPQSSIQKIGHLILATRHQTPPDSPEAALVVDIDLSILGSPPAEFENYDRAIREEYSWVPIEEFRKGRSRVLEHFLAQPFLYQTPFFRNLYENQARINLGKKIRELI